MSFIKYIKQSPVAHISLPAIVNRRLTYNRELYYDFLRPLDV